MSRCCEKIAGRKRLRLVVLLSLTSSRVNSDSKPCIAKSLRLAGYTLFVNQVKLTGAILAAKMRRKGCKTLSPGTKMLKLRRHSVVRPGERAIYCSGTRLGNRHRIPPV